MNRKRYDVVGRFGPNKLGASEASLSAVVATLNEEKFVAGILGDIAKSTRRGVEIVVSDSGSTDNTFGVVENFAVKNPSIDVTFLRASKRGVAIARNNGADDILSRGNDGRMIFFDADTRISATFLEATEREMIDRRLDAASFYSVPDTDDVLTRVLFDFSNRYFIRPLENTKRPIFVGPGIIVRKDFHRLIGGFNETVKVAEDFEYGLDATRQGRVGIITVEPLLVSTRRIEKEGPLTVTAKSLLATAGYFLRIPEMTGRLMDYEFGKHQTPSKKL